MSVIDEIATERQRQMQAEGWTLEHDDNHARGEMAKAAACYALNGALPDLTREVAALKPADRPHQLVFIRRYWPWAEEWWKPKDRRRDLVRAGALIIAEIERLDRAEQKQQK